MRQSDAGIASPGRHTEQERLAQLLAETKTAFGILEEDPTKALVFGFTATLAVTELARISLTDAKKKGSALFVWLEPGLVADARRRAEAIAKSRVAAGQAFGGVVWHTIANGLLALEIERSSETDDLGIAPPGHPAQVAQVIFAGVDRYIRTYAAASAEELERAGILGAAKIVDGSRAGGASGGVSGLRATWVSEHVRGAMMGLFVVVGLTAVAIAGQYLWAQLSEQKDRNAAFNPAVVSAFHAVERRCFAEQWPNQTVRCQGALSEIEACASAQESCEAKQTYCVLEKLGFDLPSFYKPGTKYANENPC